MFDTLFHYPRLLERHRTGPAADDRERFLTHCASGGAAHSTLLSLAPELLVIAQRIKFDGRQSISITEIQTAADHWVAYQRQNQRAQATRFTRECFIQTATAWLRFLEKLEEPHEAPAAFAEMIREFVGLNLADVDLEGGILCIRETKFYKTRWVPTGPDLTRVLVNYAADRKQRPPATTDSPFLLTQRGQRLSRAGAENAFKQLRESAQVCRQDSAR